MVSLVPNQERLKQRREEVMRTALRARKFSEEQLTKEISDFFRFAFSLKNIEILWNQEEE
ncbi:MAG: hypothetical protein KAU62_08535 [Candidatus Heimdallarchaeota archaeon]|nr:hypothetical protein [Candidatus Heimdallarchaeota archaeon]MCG3256114.1 hypothetical protein [Candidatus Heimdallarchaeota archaeon]MCK4611185.1 hypothetical protein [Candidatus Heimdallarchaeota archaeon]